MKYLRSKKVADHYIFLLLPNVGTLYLRVDIFKAKYLMIDK